ncbi:hypothetical protein [Candidatus Entotheonella palauensis]|uniref:Alpha glucuronidase N-terminal domain-containing protein n=1 Tax=Candidatus Entotheonella gemina TaxID=1429439 RepID=W4LZY4_9BACT|nr:hypothetical protein [Candidatus Entotheonella palauensis]ETX03659.1 MAG: hypothetical protein ETSY2_32845 [Candidatus Entotheonella gemina]
MWWGGIVFLALFWDGMIAGHAAVQQPEADIDLRTYQSLYLAADADESERRMGRILQKEFESLYGIRLRLRTLPSQPLDGVIILGRSASIASGLITVSEFDAAKWDGFIIKATPRHIVIAGYGAQGTIYGVYAFLKKIGLRFYP